jgi:hypothetical protein
MDTNIPVEIKIKIQEKLYGMAYVRSLENYPPKITIPEFKFIITSVKLKDNFRIRKNLWFKMAKEFEKQGILKLHGTNPIEIIIRKPLAEHIRESLEL